jgi:uncharacterized protein (DUF488 family)
MTKLFTIGFCGKKEGEFYNLLDRAGVEILVDVRLWRISRFVPWANATNLKLMLGDKYIYVPECAPTRELLDSYKAGWVTWDRYEEIFDELISKRGVEKQFSHKSIDWACLLCSEKNPEMCHRRLVAEYLEGKFIGIEIKHL